MAKPM